MGPLLVMLAVAALAAFAQFRLGVARMRRMLDANARPLDDPALREAIARVAAASGVEGIEARLFAAPVVNGLATPDGRVFLTTALYDKYRSGQLTAEEVASVAAHEIGHVALGHHRRRLIDWTGQNAAKLALGLVLNRFLPIVGFYIAAFLGDLLLARLSRRDEFEADRYATALMIRAGFGAAPQIAMLRKLERLVPGAGSPGWLASHPPVEERVAAIRADAEAWSGRLA